MTGLLAGPATSADRMLRLVLAAAAHGAPGALVDGAEATATLGRARGGHERHADRLLSLVQHFAAGGVLDPDDARPGFAGGDLRPPHHAVALQVPDLAVLHHGAVAHHGLAARPEGGAVGDGHLGSALQEGVGVLAGVGEPDGHADLLADRSGLLGRGDARPPALASQPARPPRGPDLPRCGAMPCRLTRWPGTLMAATRRRAAARPPARRPRTRRAPPASGRRRRRRGPA